MRNRTKKYRGGEGYENLLLDDNYIIDNLKNILNERPLKYKFDIKLREKYGYSYYNIFIENEDNITREYNPDDEPCLSFKFYKSQEGISIYVNSINKCAPIKNYGNFILESIKEFATKYGYYSIIITSDGSNLEFNFDVDGKQETIFIDLPYLSILSTGESWYNRMGFYTAINKEQIEDNLKKISQDIGDIDDSINIINFINNKYDEYKNRENRIPVCYKLVNSYGKFRELYNFILNITKKTDTNSIQEVFQELSNYIKMNCNTITKTCSIDYETMKKIDCFIQFVFLLLELKYKATGLIYYVPRTSGGKKRKNTKAKKRKEKRKTKKR